MWAILKNAIKGFNRDSAMRLAAALAFYTIFSLGPILVIVVAVAGFVWGEQAARGELNQQISETVGPAAADQIEQILAATQQSKGGVIATVIGAVTLILAATGLFTQLRDALNTIWNVRVKPKSAVVGLIKSRLLAFGMVLTVAVMLIAMLAATTVLAGAASRLQQSDFPLPVGAVQAIEFIASWAVATVLFAAIFKWLPEVEIRWRDVWLGAAATGLLFSIGKIGLGWYLGRGSVASVYGAAGSFVAILLWVYYSMIIFLFGAELTQAYAMQRGSRIEPSENAIALTPAARRDQGMRSDDSRESTEDARPRKTILAQRHDSEQRPPSERLASDVTRAAATYFASVIQRSSRRDQDARTRALAKSPAPDRHR